MVSNYGQIILGETKIGARILVIVGFCVGLPCEHFIFPMSQFCWDWIDFSVFTLVKSRVAHR